MRLKQLRGDISISLSAKNKLDSIIQRYSDQASPSVLQVFNQGDIDENQLIKIVQTLEINGYPRKIIYDLPWDFAKRLLGSEGLYGDN